MKKDDEKTDEDITDVRLGMQDNFGTRWNENFWP